MMKIFKYPLLLLIKFYQLMISPLKQPCCRFHPTCSAYARQAVQKYGVLKGGWLFLIRFMKCHPWGPHGYDPVPDFFDWHPRRKSGKKLNEHKTKT
ncbi:MAG: membrane protein insertion efficiency factor YidD [Pseudomonadota bacterium]|jgi:hypothetical protein|nr:membrane protein insertion efficiency factor YidD [Pseudomonadota bacterium]QKK04283.1 MAG: membrane protein insertion efficiency factor YidD [Pseudomonadota bacterium]|tara:strand:+ start:508 stop:795 length:288 start_codon:yes stop_codon:yes gene_type:complete